MINKKLYAIGFGINILFISGCTGPELNLPSMLHHPNTRNQHTTHQVQQANKSQYYKVIQRKYYAPTPQKEILFNKEMRRVALSTQNNPKYNRMSLDTPEKKEWFKTLMYRLWDRQITRDEFISQGVIKYPTHRYEFEFIANGFQNH